MKLFMSYLTLLTVLVLVIRGEELKQIRPGDAYKISGSFERYFTDTNCTVDVVWLKPPVHSTMAFHGHDSACSRISFKDDLKHDNKTAQMIDMWSLNELLVLDKFQDREWNELKCFFIKNRIGDSAISVLIQPRINSDKNLKIKLDIIDLKREATHMPPQDILCARFSCPKVETILVHTSLNGTESDLGQEDLARNLSANSITYRLTEKELLNMELNKKLIIYRIACALLGGLTILFAILTASMCIKTRNYPKKLKKMSSMQQNCILPYNFDANQTSSYYHMNGKLGITPPSPLISNSDPRHHHSLDTASVNNILMTNSSLSACDGHLGNGNQTYVSYPISGLGGNQTYSESNNNNMLAFVPIVNRPQMSTNSTRNYLVSCSNSTNQLNHSNNGNCSPSSSILDSKLVSNNTNGSITSSLSRQHSNNLSRRKIVVLGKNISSFNTPETNISPNLLNQYNNNFNESTFGKAIMTPNMNGHDSVIHRFPNDFQSTLHQNGSRINSDIGDNGSFVSSLNNGTANNKSGNQNSNNCLQVQ